MVNLVRKIIHIDMDAFFASVEQMDNPNLRGRPITVGGGMQGVVAAASYEARKYGVKSAMPGKIALQKCPNLIVVKPRFQRYKQISKIIHEIFYEYTDLVEPLSLDEAYLDVTVNKKNMSLANEIAREIRSKIYSKTGLTASAGISINKFLAKVASDYNKPNGQKTIHPTQINEFIEGLNIEKFYGIGKVTANKMHQLHIYNGKDLKEKSLEFLTHYFGKSGLYYFNVAKGIHTSEVKPLRIQKSVGVEETFWDNLYDEEAVQKELLRLCNTLEKRTSANDIKGKTLTLKIKYNDFSVFTRSKTEIEFIQTSTDFYSLAQKLWIQRPYDKSIRLLGLYISNLNTQKQKRVYVQLSFPFDE